MHCKAFDNSFGCGGNLGSGTVIVLASIASSVVLVYVSQGSRRYSSSSRHGSGFRMHQHEFDGLSSNPWGVGMSGMLRATWVELQGWVKIRSYVLLLAVVLNKCSVFPIRSVCRAT